MIKKILLLTDTKEYANLIKSQSKNTWKIIPAFSEKQVLKLLNKQKYDCILLDSRVTYIYSHNTYTQLEKAYPLFIIQNSTQNKNIFKSIKYIEKFTVPYIFSDIDAKISSHLQILEAKKSYLYSDLIGTSNEINKVRSFIKKASQLEFPVMLYGESGSGKDLVANIIHKISTRNQNPFIPVNVNTIPVNLAESMLFGTVKGAYTGAENKTGIFEQAHTGSVFLDEIESLNMELQAKFLRVLETKKVAKLGTYHSSYCDFRVISASNQPLSEAIKKNQFREDLYYRLDVLRFTIPPLRKHKEDIFLLSNKYLNKYNKMISSTALEKLQNHIWPGNIRELHNCLARAVCYSNHSDIIHDRHIMF